MYRLFSLLTFIVSASSIIVSDSGCNCLSNGTCATKLDWTGQMSKWCVTDGSCGAFQAGFGYVDSCALAGIPSVNLTTPLYLEWDQANYTYYTGQTLTVNWTSQNIVYDLVKITYQGTSLRTLTTGVNITNRSYSIRLSDTGSWLTTTVPVVLTSVNTPYILANSSQLLTVVQSKISYVNVYNGPTLVVNGNSFPCDNRNLTIQWRGLGQAGVGIASVTIRSGGGGTTVGTALTGLIAQGNMTVNYTLPRSFVPNGFTTYSAQISVQSPGVGVTPYTLNSISFGLSAAPSLSPTSTPTPTPTPSISVGSTSSTTPSISSTPTQTPSPSLSIGATASVTSTISNTPSQTPTLTPTSTPPPDLAALSRAAVASSLSALELVIGATIGGIAFVCVVGGVSYKVYQRKLLHERRRRRLGNTRAYEDDRTVVYGITREVTPQQQHFTNIRAYRSSQPKRVI